MLDLFNNSWIIILSIVIIFVVFKKIYYLNKPFDKDKFIYQYLNKNKIKNKLSNIDLHKELSTIASYYVGI